MVQTHCWNNVGGISAKTHQHDGLGKAGMCGGGRARVRNIRIDGKVPPTQRQALVDKFQARRLELGARAKLRCWLAL